MKATGERSLMSEAAVLYYEKKHTQQEIAELLKMTTGSYNQYEVGRTEPNIDTLCKLADYYGVSLDYLVGRLDYAEHELKHLTVLGTLTPNSGAPGNKSSSVKPTTISIPSLSKLLIADALSLPSNDA